MKLEHHHLTIDFPKDVRKPWDFHHSCLKPYYSENTTEAKILSTSKKMRCGWLGHNHWNNLFGYCAGRYLFDTQYNIKWKKRADRDEINRNRCPRGWYPSVGYQLWILAGSTSSTGAHTLPLAVQVEQFAPCGCAIARSGRIRMYINPSSTKTQIWFSIGAKTLLDLSSNASEKKFCFTIEENDYKCQCSLMHNNKKFPSYENQVWGESARLKRSIYRNSGVKYFMPRQTGI